MQNLLRIISEDTLRYKENYKYYFLNLCFLFVVFFRICKHIRYHRNSVIRLIGGIIFLPFYYFLRPFLGIYLPLSTTIEGGFLIYHYGGIVINGDCTIGRNFTLRQNCTLGNRVDTDDVPTIGNNVELGANCCVLGKITIGDNVKIGAGTVVVENIVSNHTVVGSRSRILSN